VRERGRRDQELLIRGRDERRIRSVCQQALSALELLDHDPDSCATQRGRAHEAIERALELPPIFGPRHGGEREPERDQTECARQDCHGART
jgi:hypothetical protein